MISEVLNYLTNLFSSINFNTNNMRSVKILLIAGEISAVLCAIISVWAVCLEEIECDAVTAIVITMFIICSVALQSMQKRD